MVKRSVRIRVHPKWNEFRKEVMIKTDLKNPTDVDLILLSGARLSLETMGFLPKIGKRKNETKKK